MLCACIIAFRLTAPAPASAAAVPAHVQTFLFWGVNGTPKGEPHVSNREAAKWVTWGMSAPHESYGLAAAGIKMVYYTNPNRVFRKSKFFNANDESEFAHDCDGRRITVRGRANQFLTDPESAAVANAWRAQAQDALAHGQFAAVFDDTAASTGQISSLPCGFDSGRWVAAHVRLVQALGSPVLFNGLGDGQLVSRGKRGPDADYSPSPVTGLAAARNAIGGSFEDCYVSPDPDNGPGKTVNSYWRQTENAELGMARRGKYFVCNERVDRIEMDGAFDMRTYAEASLLLTYDAKTTIVRQQFQTPSWFNLGPEVEIVPLDPVVRAPATIDALRKPGGTYAREYLHCFVAGSPVGRCAAVVNPDSHAAHEFPFARYQHTMTLDGGGIIDGGRISIGGLPPPAELPPASAVVAFE
jgi:hypothetical protein